MIKKIAVIGSGVMGASIAAQIANNNCHVLLFDLKDPATHELISQKSLKNLHNIKPKAFTIADKEQYITPLSIEDDLEKIKDCDLIIEAIIENLDIKIDLYKKLENFIKKDAILASNTSTFSLASLQEKISSDLKNRMVIVHFFNPPRYMKLIELVISEKYPLSEGINSKLSEFLEYKLGKILVKCKDTPGFIANRIGCFLLGLTLHEVIKHKADIEIIDQLFIKYLKFPRTGIFALYDLIGIDVMYLINQSLFNSLNENDFYNIFKNNQIILSKMIDNGLKGSKSGSGFYKKQKNEDGSNLVKKYNFAEEYISLKKHNDHEIYSNLSEILSAKDVNSVVFKNILSKFFAYILNIYKDISYSIQDIDIAMRLGYSWKMGPFEMLISNPDIKKYIINFIESDNQTPDHKKFLNQVKNNIEILENISLKDINNESDELISYVKENKIKPLSEGDSYRIWPVKKGKICFEIMSKMGVLSSSIFKGIIECVELCEEENSEMIIYSSANNFSVGADLNFFYEISTSIKNNQSLLKLNNFLEIGQKALLKIKNSKIAVISVAKGYALGGGCEILLHSNYVIAHQELNSGLVEASVRLIPGWGGLKESILKSSSKEDFKNNILNILSSFKSSSADEFASKYKIKNLISLANDKKLFSYAIDNNFKKQKSSSKFELSHIIDEKELLSYPNTKLYSLLYKNLKQLTDLDNLEEKLLNIERVIFSELLFTESTRALIQKIINR